MHSFAPDAGWARAWPLKITHAGWMHRAKLPAGEQGKRRHKTKAP